MTDLNRGADLVVAALKAAGVDVIFTLSGNHIMVLYDALLGSGITLIHVRHEAAAVHMADGYARLTGRVGVALVTGGQGHTNAVAALPTALAAEAPVLLLSGHAPLNELGRGAFQEMAQVDVAHPLTKASWLCQAGEQLSADIARAIRLALGGRPGPVHLSLPTDLLDGRFAAAATPAEAEQETGASLSSDAADTLLELIKAAQRPMVLAGPRWSGTSGREALAAFERATAIPAVMMESPRGLADPSLGAFAQVLKQADLVVLLGKPHDFTIRFGQAPFVADTARFAVIDDEEAMIERVRREQGERLAASWCEQGVAALAALSDALTGKRDDERWLRAVQEAIAYRPAAFATATGTEGRIHPLDICRAVQKVIDSHPDSIFVSDGGEIGQWAQTGVTAQRRIINGVAGSIGSAIPFAISARIVDPVAPVIAVMGDGTFGFHMAEIDTAVRYRLPVVIIVGNDGRWNAEHQIQLRSYGAERAHSCSLLATRYDQVAIALGGYGEFVTAPRELGPAIDRAIASGMPACVNVMIEGLPAPAIRRD